MTCRHRRQTDIKQTNNRQHTWKNNISQNPSHSSSSAKNPNNPSAKNFPATYIPRSALRHINRPSWLYTRPTGREFISLNDRHCRNPCARAQSITPASGFPRGQSPRYRARSYRMSVTRQERALTYLPRIPACRPVIHPYVRACAPWQCTLVPPCDAPSFSKGGESRLVGIHIGSEARGTPGSFFLFYLLAGAIMIDDRPLMAAARWWFCFFRFACM